MKEWKIKKSRRFKTALNFFFVFFFFFCSYRWVLFCLFGYLPPFATSANFLFTDFCKWKNPEKKNTFWWSKKKFLQFIKCSKAMSEISLKIALEIRIKKKKRNKWGKRFLTFFTESIKFSWPSTSSNEYKAKKKKRRTCFSTKSQQSDISISIEKKQKFEQLKLMKATIYFLQ